MSTPEPCRPRAEGGRRRLGLATLGTLVFLGSACAGREVRPPPSGPGLGVAVGPGVPAPAAVDDPSDPDRLPGRFAVPAGGPEDVAWRLALVARARPILGHQTVVLEGRRWRSDCSGLVVGLFAGSGVDLLADGPLGPGENGVAILHRFVASRDGLHRGPPRPGDLAFFHDTYDANRNGYRDDPLTHVAVVEALEADGTVVLLHHVGGRVRRGRMNLARPDEHRDPESGLVLNDYLRRGRGRRLAGQLFAGYGVVRR